MCLCYYRTRNAPSFISCACPADLSNRDWKSAPPCCQAILMADFILSATTIAVQLFVKMYVVFPTLRAVSVGFFKPLARQSSGNETLNCGILFACFGACDPPLLL